MPQRFLGVIVLGCQGSGLFGEEGSLLIVPEIGCKYYWLHDQLNEIAICNVQYSTLADPD
jgi:hypothetical protein